MSKNKKKFRLNKVDNVSKHQETVIPIKGMHCRSCEILIAERLQELSGVKSVQVSYKKSQATIYFEGLLSTDDIKDAIEESGYGLGINSSKPWISKNFQDYYELTWAAFILLIIYIVAKQFGLFDINVASNNPSSLLVVLLVGLTAGLSTCMALVGGLILGIAARHSEKHPDASPTQKFRPHLYFNIGRIGSYFILGGVIGLIGKAFQLSGPTLGVLTIIVGLVMLTLGLQLTEVFPKLSSGGLTLPAGISKFLGLKKKNDKEYSHSNSLIIGALTFFLPCGFTQAMQLYAMSTGSFIQGAMIMGIFALGTAPGLLGIGGLTSIVRGSFAKKFFKFAGLMVIALSIFNLSNGYNLTGWSGIFSGDSGSTEIVDDPNVVMENGIQVARMKQLPGGYQPNKFVIKKGIPVKWIVEATNIDVCSSSIVANKIGIKKFLELGENIFEFTPKETGEIKFSCTMGMYSGKFIVIEGNVSEQDTSAGKQVVSEENGSEPKPDSVSKNDSVVDISDTDIQIIKATYQDYYNDISPKEFSVQAGKKVRFEISSKEDGDGCMASIMIPGLVDRPEFLTTSKIIRFEFTPEKRGTYLITCAMGVPRGEIVVTS